MEFIKKQLNELKQLLEKQNIYKKEYLTLEDAKEYLQLSASALYKLTSKKLIPYYVPNGKKLYFKRVELNLWIAKSKVYSSDEVEKDLEKYLCRTNNN